MKILSKYVIIYWDITKSPSKRENLFKGKRMNQNQFLVQTAVELNAILGRGNNLQDGALQLLQDRGYKHVTIDAVMKETAANEQARSYYRCRRNIETIYKLSTLKILLRNLWLRDFLSSYRGVLTKEELLKALQLKYEAEKVRYQKLTQEEFALLPFAEALEEEDIEPMAEVCAAFSDLFPAAYPLLDRAIGYFSKLTYMSEIYIKQSLRAQGSDQAGQGERPRVQTISMKGASGKGDEALITMLRDQIRFLERENHDLEVKLNFAKKDAIRDILCSLTAGGWGAPLHELYRIYCSDQTPENIRGVVNNFFKALESENVRLVKEKEVGKEIVLDEENQSSYDPFRHEEIVLGETVTVYYPGYRFDREVMIKPVIRKK